MIVAYLKWLRGQNLLTDQAPTQMDLLLFSEWLDERGFIVGEENGDLRSHDKLTGEFLAS